MTPSRAHCCWTAAYFASWVLAAGGACGFVATVLGTICSGRLIDDDASLLGFPLGIVLGFVAARSTLRRRGVHRGLVIGGMLAATLGTAGAVTMFTAASHARGEGPYAGLGDALAGFGLACIAAIGVAFLAAGATGRLAARTAPGQP